MEEHRPVEIRFAIEDGTLWWQWRGMNLPRDQFNGHFLPDLKEEIGLPPATYFDMSGDGLWSLPAEVLEKYRISPHTARMRMQESISTYFDRDVEFYAGELEDGYIDIK